MSQPAGYWCNEAAPRSCYRRCGVYGLDASDGTCHHCGLLKRTVDAVEQSWVPLDPPPSEGD